MNFIKKNLCKLFLIAFLLVLPVISFAQTTPSQPTAGTTPSNPSCDPAGGKICPPINQTTIQGFIQTFLEGVLRIGIPVVALAIIYCGFLFVSARGSSEKLTKAKDALLYTLIGAAILLGSWAIAELISETVLAL